MVHLHNVELFTPYFIFTHKLFSKINLLMWFAITEWISRECKVSKKIVDDCKCVKGLLWHI